MVTWRLPAEGTCWSSEDSSELSYTEDHGQEVRPGACLTSFSVSEYSLSLSTATMLVSISDDIRTSQFKYVVTCEGKSHPMGLLE